MTRKTLDRSPVVSVIVIVSALFCVCGPGRGDEPKRTQPEPAALNLLSEVAKAYAGLPAYSDRGEFVTTLKIAGKPVIERSPIRLTFVRPNKLDVDTGIARLISDGKTLTTVSSPLKTYESQPSPKTISFNTLFTAGPVGSALFGGPGGPMMSAIVNLLVGKDAIASVRELGDTLTLGEDRVIEDKNCRTLSFASPNREGYSLRIDPATKLILAIELIHDQAKVDAEYPADAKLQVESFSWRAGAVSMKPAADSAFGFEPLKDFKKLESLAAAGPAEDEGPKYKVKELVGKPAPSFVLTLLESESKLKTVSLKDLSGKVVVIDFWATWCGPCLSELPELQKLIEAYANDKKEVVVVALSEDNDPRDPLEVRKLVESTLEKKKIVLVGNAVGKEAIDPSNSVGELFQVEGYPTVVVIDAKGVVRAAHVGNSPDIRKLLTKDIDEALGTRPVVPDAPGAK